MAELETAFSTLTDVLSTTEKEIGEEVKVIEQQIQQLQDRIVELNSRQQTLVHDRESIGDMYKRYCQSDSEGKAVEF
jgi:TolA-binding protein